MVEIENEDELKVLEIEMIAKFNSYYNGYNETKGGDGNYTLFDFETRCSIFEFCKRYAGINRKLAKLLDCDDSVIAGIRDNKVYSLGNFNEDQIQEWVKILNLSETDLIENYIPHNGRKLNKQQVFEFLAVIEKNEGYAKQLCREFQVGPTIGHRLQHKQIYKDFIEEFELLSDYEKDEIMNKTFEKYNLVSKKAQNMRHVKDGGLTQEQVNYILDNKDNKKRVEIAKDLNISADRVGNVILGKSYKDLVTNYYKNSQ